jgi:hypothetical protein
MKNAQKQILILLLAGVSFSAMAQDKEQRTTEERTVSSFNAIEVNDRIDLVLSQGATQWVKVEAKDPKSVSVEVKDGQLNISDNKKEKEEDDVTVYVNFVKIDQIVQNGITEVSSTGILSFDSLRIDQSGASDLELKITTGTLRANISGAGEMELSGSAKNSIVTISGAGNFDAKELITEKTNIDISGAGNAEINAKDEISASISGVGNLSFKEEPAVRNIEISGFGSVNGEKNKSHSYNYSYPGGGYNYNYSYEYPDKEDDEDKDSTKFKWGDKKVIIIDEDEEDKEDDKNDDFNRWSGIDISINSMLNRNNTTTLPPGYDFLELDYARSLNLDFNLFEKDIHIFRNYVNLTTGIGFRFSSYGFKNNIILVPDTNHLAAVPSDIKEYRKNKLNSTWVTVPLMLEFNSNSYNDKCWHLSGGVLLGYKLGSRTKQVYEIDGDRKKEVNRGDYSLNPFKADLMVRLGYGNFRLFATYGLMELFESGEGPQLYPFTVGLTLINF